MSFPDPSPELVEAMYRDYGAVLEESHRRLPFGPDAKRSMMARFTLSSAGIVESSWLPVLIDTELRPEVLLSEDPRHAEMVAYMEWCSDRVPHTFKQVGDRVVVQ